MSTVREQMLTLILSAAASQDFVSNVCQDEGTVIAHACIRQAEAVCIIRLWNIYPIARSGTRVAYASGVARIRQGRYRG